MKPGNSSMVLDHDSANEAFVMNVERDKCLEHPINNNASEAVFSEEEEQPIKKMFILKYPRKKIKGAEKSSSLLQEDTSIIDNNTAHSVLTQQKCDLLFKYSRRKRKSHDSLQNCVEPILVPAQTSEDRSNEVSVKEVKILEVCTLERPRIGCVSKKLLILDVNGLLADIVSNPFSGYQADIVVSGKSVFKRPFCDDFLSFCFDKFHVGVWSSRVEKNLDPLIGFLFGVSRDKLRFCWDQYRCTNTGFKTPDNVDKPLFLKELKYLWEKLGSARPLNEREYDESNTLLLDDSPYKALRNPVHTAIFPHSYSYTDTADSSLGPKGALRVYLEQLAEAQNVQQYVAQHPFGQRAITNSDPSWGLYRCIASADYCQSHNVANTSVTCQP